MKITNITDFDNITDYDSITSTNTTTCNCTDNEFNIDIIIPALIFTLWSIIFMFIEFDGSHINQTFIQ